MKKFISFILAIAILIVPSIDFKALASANEFTYTVCDGEITITGHKNNLDGIVQIPDYINDYPVRIIGTSAFDYCKGITSVIIPEGIVKIDELAFSNCSEITSVSIPKSLEWIGANAFRSCSSLTDVYIYDNVSYVGNYAFQDCSSLQKIRLSNNLISIGAGTFRGCEKLEEVIIPNKVETIGDYAFYSCLSLNNVSIPCSAKITNSKYTFFRCSNIENINITIGSGTMLNYTNSQASQNDTYYQFTPWFISNDNLKTINLENGITNVGDYSFYGCTSINEINIPDSITSIGECAFYDCSNLSIITVSKRIKEVGNCAFNNTAYFNDEKNWQDGVLYLSNLLLVSKDDKINYEINENKKCIANNAFSNCTELEKIVIPEGVKIISSNAFYNCENLKNIVLPNTILEIGKYAFHRCINLKSIEIPESTISIGEGAFCFCTHLRSIILPNKLHSIPIKAFSQCYSLSNITLPSDLTEISSEAFYYCSNLVDIEIPNNVNIIGYNAFYNCSDLRKIVIPCSAKIQDDAFKNVSKINEITLSKGTGIMQNYKRNDLDNSDNSIYKSTPWYTSKNSVEKIFLDEGIEKIGNYAFYDSVNLKEIIFPSTLTQIGMSAFEGCYNLIKLTFPKSISTIKTKAFYNCENLTNVSYYGTKSDWDYIDIEEYNEDLINSSIEYNYHIHTYDNGVVTKQETCVSNGTKTYNCTVDGCTTSKTEIIEKTGHTEVVDKAVVPTCSKTGLTAGSHCSVCGEVIVAQKPVAKTAHTYKNAVTKATTKANGKITPTCSCGATDTATIIYYPKTVALSKTSYVYDGKAKKPSVTVKDSNGKTISSSNYSVSYSNNTKAGQATVKVTFKGNYSGVISKTFTITPKATTISSVSAASKAFTVKWKKQSTETTGYEIQYSTDKNFKKNNKTVTFTKNSTTSKKVTGLKTKTKYYVRIRTYKTVKVNGKSIKVYSTWSKANVVTTKK